MSENSEFQYKPSVWQEPFRKVNEEIDWLEIRVELSPHMEFPDIDMQKLADIQPDMSGRIEIIEEWLALPFMYDRFGNDHGLRGAWWLQATREWAENPRGQEFLAQYRQNKFRGSQVNIVFNSMEFFTYLLGKTQGRENELYKNLKRIVDEIDIRSYNNHQDIAQRRQFIDRLSAKAMEFLSVLSQSQQPH